MYDHDDIVNVAALSVRLLRAMLDSVAEVIHFGSIPEVNSERF
ncbi:hypothetical protein ACPOL_3158 [Acidisarcina polymorpha]|uniref:Uncharacterized protein n=1 Tax=Acidisarcina polymorpha TaxID=2211140 RepID=A0A2Z5FZV4_9BACT|nr:hypothetical protein ACPOL_3158 [Acidisarcina polymorpha]